MRSKAYCGKGYGVSALKTLCQFLTQRLGVAEFMVQPSVRTRKRVLQSWTSHRASLKILGDRWTYSDSVLMIARGPWLQVLNLVVFTSEATVALFGD